MPIYHGIRAIHGDRCNFRMAALPVTLEDKYTLASGRVYINGTQALVRLAMMQRERDLAAGLNTAGFISGYRGSPSVASTRRSGSRRATSRNTTSTSRRA